MIFFLDENISRRAARMLEAFDPQHEVRAFTEVFNEGTPDAEWLQDLGTYTPRPILICGDGRILRSKAERAILGKANLMFV